MRDEAKQRIIGYLLAALGLVAGLAWNDAIKALINYLVPIERNSILLQFIYAIIITGIVVVIASCLTRFTKNSEKDHDTKQ